MRVIGLSRATDETFHIKQLLSLTNLLFWGEIFSQIVASIAKMLLNGIKRPSGNHLPELEMFDNDNKKKHF